IGLLLMNYILENKKDIPKNSAVVSTVVSTPMLDIVAKEKGVKIFRTLTGFKFIGEKIREFEERKYDATFLMGFEESYGYLVGTHARDKDAVVSTLLIAEMAAYYNSIGSSIPKELKKLYEKFGYYREGIIAITKKGKDGVEAISKIMSNLRANVSDSLLGKTIVSKRDFSLGYEGLPKSDVIQFVLEDNTYITARPSGTEPKIKYYFCVVGKTEIEANEKLMKTMEDFQAFID
ncbi:MAG: phospho-sugar mutase, partial [Cetobacterium sp.]